MSEQIVNASTVPEYKEVIQHELYDAMEVEATTTGIVNFFQDRTGKDILLTNMKADGQMPSGYDFDIRSIRCILEQDIAIADAHLLARGCAVRVVVGEKEMFQVPLIMLSAGCGVTGMGSGTIATESYQLGTPQQRDTYGFDIPIKIESQQNFRLELHIPDALAALTIKQEVMFILGGVLKRPVQ